MFTKFFTKMKKLELGQMERVQGGGELLDAIVATTACAVVGHALGLGFGGHLLCHGLLHSNPAH